MNEDKAQRALRRAHLERVDELQHKFINWVMASCTAKADIKLIGNKFRQLAETDPKRSKAKKHWRNPMMRGSLHAYVRWAGSATSEAHHSEIMARLAEVKAAYAEYMATHYPDEELVYPSSFLIDIPDARRLTVSVYDAWNVSDTFEPDGKAVVWGRNDCKHDENHSLIRFFYPSFETDGQRGWCDASELYSAMTQQHGIEFAPNDRLYARRWSGSKYVANIYDADYNQRKIAFTFLLLPPECEVSLTPPRKPRNDKKHGYELRRIPAHRTSGRTEFLVKRGE